MTERELRELLRRVRSGSTDAEADIVEMFCDTAAAPVAGRAGPSWVATDKPVYSDEEFRAMASGVRLSMAEGCCSAVSPCSHQQRDPYSICETCQKASAPPLPTQPAREEVREALQLAYSELKKHDADYHYRTPVEINNKIVDALAQSPKAQEGGR